MKVLGVIKIVIGSIFILSGILNLVKKLSSVGFDLYMAGYTIGVFIVLFFAGWLIKSGWSNLNK